MVSCERFRPLLHRISEGDATPEEALSVGRHLFDCTGCKILLARERRLDELLERELLDRPVGEEFVQSVMGALPEGPPPSEEPVDDPGSANRRKWRSRLKLAGFALLLTTGAALGQAPVTWSAGAPSLGAPVLEFGPGGTIPAIERILGLAWTAVEAFGHRMPFESLPGASWPLVGFTLLLLPLVAGLTAASTVVVVAANSLLRVKR